MAMNKNPQAGEHNYAGTYCPGDRHTAWMETFSVGCFEWIPAKGGGLKRSKTKVRVRGRCVDAESVYDRAHEICDALDEGTYEGPKVVTVKAKEATKSKQ